MKKLLLIVMLFGLASLCYGADIEVPSLGVDSNSLKLQTVSDQSVIIAPLDLDKIAFRLSSPKTHLTIGLGVGNDFIGGITQNGLGEPKNSFSLNTYLGFSYTTYFGSKSVDEIFAEVKKSGNRFKDEAEMVSWFQQKYASSTFSYFRVGTAALIYPVVVQYGYCWMPGAHTRFEIGFGLPTLLGLGFNLDF